MQIDIEKWLAEVRLTIDGRSDEVVSLVKNIPAAFDLPPAPTGTLQTPWRRLGEIDQTFSYPTLTKFS